MGKSIPSYHFGDTWCSGGFTLQELGGIDNLILEHFDVPAWPELLALGEKETLSGFWLPLYSQWLEPQGVRVQIDEALSNRAGIQLFHNRFVGNPLQLIKGQMIGPATLKWCLQKNKQPIGSDDHIVNFIVEAAIAQIQVLSKWAWNIVLCFDEPSAAFVPEAEALWHEVFLSLDKYRPFGLALHCCGEWKLSWLRWPWQVVHFDVQECLNLWAKDPKTWTFALESFFNRGSWMVAGVLSSSALALENFDPMLLVDFLETVKALAGNQIMLSSTCGLDCKSEDKLRQRLNSFAAATEIAKTVCTTDKSKTKSF